MRSRRDRSTLVTVWGVLAAAGMGDRLRTGGGVPKAFQPVAGTPMYLYGLRALDAVARIEGVVVVVPVSWLEYALATSVERRWRVPIDLRPGGPTRGASVRAALEAIPASADVVAVHDAARPVVTPAMIEAALDGLGDADGAVPVVARAGSAPLVAGGERFVADDRWETQTPQAFRAAALRSARAHDTAIDDDAVLLAGSGASVVAFPGSDSNLAIVTDEELARAGARIARGATS